MPQGPIPRVAVSEVGLLTRGLNRSRGRALGQAPRPANMVAQGGVGS
jgi:hypothetical protein